MNNPPSIDIFNFTKRYAVWILLFLGFFTRFLFFGHPNSAVFDEIYFNDFASSYYTGEYYYDIHPPLGKLLLALCALPAGGLSTGDVVKGIGDSFSSGALVAMRFLPALSGAILPAVIFLFSRALGFRHLAAFLAGLFVILDNGLLAQSRLILMDSMLLLFGFLSIYFLIQYLSTKRLPWLVAAGVCLGVSISIKWIALFFFGFGGLVILANAIKVRHLNAHHIFAGLAYSTVAFLLYVTCFFVHFSLLPNSGSHGDAFMSKEFRSTLSGGEFNGATKKIQQFNCPSHLASKLHIGMVDVKVPEKYQSACAITYEPLELPGFLGKFKELHEVMWRTNRSLTAKHPDSSKWYEWPIMKTPIYYWVKEQKRIYFIGNPALWWAASLVAILAVMSLFSVTGFNNMLWGSGERRNPLTLIGAGGSLKLILVVVAYIAALLPFAMITRVMFLYHYLIALVFSFIILAHFISSLKHSRIVAPVFVAYIFVAFIYFSPISYGLDWNTDQLLAVLKFMGWE